ncbi:hypothetical protein TFLX_05055 [Thermoflexales bacterium]|nr:hypothetical protein TFLX_05055 [Thermoflexales bacterium]
MQPRQQLDYLEKQIQLAIDKFKKKADQNKRRTYTVNLASASLGALITIALGITVPEQATLLKNFALVCGALIAIVNAVQSVFAYRDLWLKQKGTLLQFYSLRNQIEFYRAGLAETDEVSDEQVARFFEVYQRIWQEDSTEWLRLRKDNLAQPLNSNH